MRLIRVFFTAHVLAVPAGRAVAVSTDCEAARRAVQEALDQECPCETMANHGRYVCCVAHVRSRPPKQGAIPTNYKGAVQRCAARSVCGKEGAITSLPESRGLLCTS